MYRDTSSVDCANNLPEDIVCKITPKNNIRRENTCDPILKLLNEEITSDIQKHKQNIWKEHVVVVATTRSVFKSVKVSVVEIAKRTN